MSRQEAIVESEDPVTTPAFEVTRDQDDGSWLQKVEYSANGAPTDAESAGRRAVRKHREALERLAKEE